jgi:hypothetical protein
MKKKSLALLITLFSLSLTLVPTVFASPGGVIIITPPWPLTQNAPATFTISVNTAANPTYDPALLLVMTTACHAGLTGNIIVTWSSGSISFAPSDFMLLTGNGKIPDSSISDKRYERASLADHLSASGESVYWAMKDFPIGTLTTTPKTFTVTLPSSAPRMLIYALGKSSNPHAFAYACCIKYDRWVPPTNPGFVVPELGPILLALASFSAFGLYAVKRRKMWK